MLRSPAGDVYVGVIRIDRIDDPRLDDYRNVSDAELLRRRSLFVGEGRLVVRRLLASAHAVASLLLNEPSLRILEAESPGAIDRLPVYLCPNAELAEIVGFKFHRGCLALAHRPPDTPAGDVMRGGRLLVVLDGVTDPDNVGSVFRNAAAFGADGVLLCACCDPLYRKAVRTSMGHVLQMPYGRLPDRTEGIAALKASGFRVMALTPDQSAIPLAEFAGSAAWRGALAMLVGGEGEGLSAASKAGADVCVRIPMHRGVDSLNLSTAVAIALHRLTGASALS